MPLALTDGQLKQAMQAASLIRRATVMASGAALPPREIMRGKNCRHILLRSFAITLKRWPISHQRRLTVLTRSFSTYGICSVRPKTLITSTRSIASLRWSP